jgi:hypothetical protein
MYTFVAEKSKEIPEDLSRLFGSPAEGQLD